MRDQKPIKVCAVCGDKALGKKQIKMSISIIRHSVIYSEELRRSHLQVVQTVFQEERIQN